MRHADAASAAAETALHEAGLNWRTGPWTFLTQIAGGDDVVMSAYQWWPPSARAAAAVVAIHADSRAEDAGEAFDERSSKFASFVRWWRDGDDETDSGPALLGGLHRTDLGALKRLPRGDFPDLGDRILKGPVLCYSHD